MHMYMYYRIQKEAPTSKLGFKDMWSGECAMQTVEETEKKRAAKAERMKNRHVHIQIQVSTLYLNDILLYASAPSH
jgi:hypothetical protein